MSFLKYKCPLCNSSELEKSEICELKCKHFYCWKCIEKYLVNNLKSKMKCPDNECRSYINDAIVREILPEAKVQEYERLCMPINCDNLFRCLLPECDNIIFYDSKFIQFECHSCSLFNCIDCKATHPFLSCFDYQQKKMDVTNSKCQQHLKEMENMEFSRARQYLRGFQNRILSENLRVLNFSDLLANNEAFTCSICTKVIQKGSGITLRKCCHDFCRSCLQYSVKNCENIPINCPGNDCKSKLEDREIHGILTENEYRIYQLKCNEMAKSKIENIFHCKFPDCTFFGIVDYSKYDHFRCPVCKCSNCIKCSTIHKNEETCEEFQNKVCQLEDPDQRSLAFISNEIKTGKCMTCPSCGVVINKTGGCNWIQCPQCKLELCWILKIPRWGPKGRGDTSGGCKCGLNNIPCDQRCILGCIPE